MGGRSGTGTVSFAVTKEVTKVTEPASISENSNSVHTLRSESDKDDLPDMRLTLQEANKSRNKFANATIEPTGFIKPMYKSSRPRTSG
jgi:hypothetical protein